jgi:hypothetical protein
MVTNDTIITTTLSLVMALVLIIYILFLVYKFYNKKEKFIENVPIDPSEIMKSFGKNWNPSADILTQSDLQFI